MKIRLKFEKTNLIRLIVAMIFAAVLYYKVTFPVYVLAGFGACYFLIKSLEIEINNKWLKLALNVVLLGGSSVMTAYMVQYLLLDAELRAKITDTKMFLNVLCCLVVYVVVQVFTKNAGLTCVISHIALMIFAGINYFVYLFRGNEFIFSDLRSISTGLSVAGNYEFVLDDRAVYVVLLSVLYVAFVRKIHVKFEKRLWMAVVCISIAVFCCAYIGTETEGTVTETWEQKGSYRNGYILNYVLSIRDCFIAEPDGYSEEVISELEDQYSGDGESYVNQHVEKNPTIIVVMSESYADLSVVGDFLTNEQVTPYYDSLQDNIMKGHALSSVFGAKTPNSEWEYMTGNSMAFLPSGSVVYQQYISDTPTSIVSNLKNIGYTCVAMHPYYETGWSRNAVYPTMGFDETHFIDDFDQTKLLRKYITDQELYESIVERYESKKANEDLFIMGLMDTIMSIKEQRISPYMAIQSEGIVLKKDILEDEKLLTLDPRVRSRNILSLINRLNKQGKIQHISHIYKYKDQLFFECMRKSNQQVQHDIKSGRTLVYEKTLNDILFTIKPDYSHIPIFLCSDSLGVYFYVTPECFSELQYFEKENYISDKLKNKESIRKLRDESNPLILYYEFK